MHMVYENVRSFALNILCAWFIHEMKKGTILVKFKTLTQATNITFFFPTHTYRAIQNNLNNCVNFSSAWVWNLITFEKATWPNTFFMTKVLQINSLIAINVIKSMNSKPVLVIKGNFFWIHNFNIFKKSKQLALHVLVSLNYFSKFSYQVYPLW